MVKWPVGSSPATWAKAAIPAASRKVRPPRSTTTQSTRHSYLLEEAGGRHRAELATQGKFGTGFSPIDVQPKRGLRDFQQLLRAILAHHSSGCFVDGSLSNPTVSR
jgi:hypothetical protein